MAAGDTTVDVENIQIRNVENKINNSIDNQTTFVDVILQRNDNNTM
jgi:hypothetical protein